MTQTIEAEHAYGGETLFSVALHGAHAGKRLRVHAYRPGDCGPQTPVLIILHGGTRAPRDYMITWAGLAEHFGFLFLVPEFSEADWPGGRSYNLGNMRDAAGQQVPRAAWSFAVIDQVFDAGRALFSNDTERYVLYGHSAGAQFVHRLVLFTGAPRACRTVAAAAGWYALPDEAIAFPYGLGGTGLGPTDLQRALACDLTVLVGDADTETEAHDLLRTEEVCAQGPHRLARARHFIARAQEAAAARGLPCNWRLEEIARVGHRDASLAHAAARLLFGDP